MKKILSFIISILVIVLVCSCGTSTESSNRLSGSVESSKEIESSSEIVESMVVESSSKVVEEKEEVVISIPEDKPLRVAQLADIHFGIEGKDWHNDKVERTKEYINYIVEEEKPDVIVCSGDNILATGVTGITSFIKMMEAYQIPWIWAYGNHDAESEAQGYKKSDLSQALVNANTKYLIYEHGYIEEGNENRYGNYSVPIYNTSKDKLLGAFIILDAGTYDYGKTQYQAITTGQIEWYKNEIDRLQSIYITQEGNKHEVIPTIVFSHIQLPEFKTAYEKALNSNGAEFVISQNLSASDIEEIGSGGPITNTGFYNVLVEKKSTKAYFVGHAHTFYFQSKMDGIVLGFAPQTGFSKLFQNNDAARKTYIYNISSDFTFTTDCCNEVVRNKGLAYSLGNGIKNANYISDLGIYTFTAVMGLWDRIYLDYYGEEITDVFTRLTYNNTTISGEIRETSGADYTSKLYYEDPDAGIFYCSNKGEKQIYKFTYNPIDKTLVIEIAEQLQLEAGQLEVLGVNKVSELSVWKKSGFTLKNENAWDKVNANIFIVVDSEGKIVYAVYNPTAGYGDPTSQSYYSHPDYADYTTNPAIQMTDNGYKIVVPEGGFAITASGHSLVKLINIIYSPTVEYVSDLEKVVFDGNTFNESLRITYNAEKKIISTHYTE